MWLREELHAAIYTQVKSKLPIFQFIQVSKKHLIRHFLCLIRRYKVGYYTENAHVLDNYLLMGRQSTVIIDIGVGEGS